MKEETEANVLAFAYTAVKALFEVFLIGFCGYLFSKSGTLTKPTLKSLSIISVNLLTPALLFSKMTETLDPALLLELWNEPLFYFIYGGFSLLWSRAGSRILKLDSEYSRLCDVATFFSNTNTLPVSLIRSIALSSGSAFLLKDADDTPLKVAARGVSYAMIFATLNNILRWSFGVALLGGMGPKSKSAFSSVCVTPQIPARLSDAAGQRGILSLPESPRLTSGDIEEDEVDELTPLYLGAPIRRLSQEQNAAVRVWDRIKSFASNAWCGIQACVTPPVYAIMAAFIVIMIPSLHESLMDPNHVLYTLWSGIDMCGDACVPLILISLGGQLGVMSRQNGGGSRKNYSNPDVSVVDETGEATRTPSATHIEVSGSMPSIILREATENSVSSFSSRQQQQQQRLLVNGDDRQQGISPKEQKLGIVMVLVGRFVFVPTLAVILISSLRIFLPNLLPIMANDPVYILALLILSSTPPAINLITVSQATGKFETEAAQILFYGYILGIFVLAVEVSGYLWLTSVLSSL